MERTLDPEVLASALGEHRAGGVLPSAQDLLAAMSELEVAAFRGEREIEDETLATAWYLHGLAALAPETPGYDAVRVRRAFAASAHLMDLALGDKRRPEAERLQIAFAAQAGYRRSEQDPNATAVYREVRALVDITGELRGHIGTLAVEAGVVFLGFDRPELGRALRAWRRQLRGARVMMRRESLAGTMYGPAEAVVEAIFHLYQFLGFGEELDLLAAQRLLRDVMAQTAGRGDRLDPHPTTRLGPPPPPPTTPDDHHRHPRTTPLQGYNTRPANPANQPEIRSTATGKIATHSFGSGRIIT